MRFLCLAFKNIYIF
uniref:Uncharacterized protein n=1 Tax=Anguilla anguilla TaxID=7936 RepID=A0A0E9VKJ4_ANGAN